MEHVSIAAELQFKGNAAAGLFVEGSARRELELDQPSRGKKRVAHAPGGTEDAFLGAPGMYILPEVALFFLSRSVPRYS